MGARNLAAHVAKAPILLLIDVDMVIPKGMLRRFVSESKQHRPGLVLYPYLVHSADKRKDATSPNVHFIRRKDFFIVGGYCEDYAGHKGWSDCLLQQAMIHMMRYRKSEQMHLILYHDSNIPDAQVRTLDRDVTHNKKLYERHLALCKRIGFAAFAKTNKRIRFEWEQIR
jgi:hypothetical protein